MKRISRLHWWLRLLCIVAMLVATGIGLNRLYRWHINRALMLATERGDATEISRRISEGADVNAPISHKQTKPTPATYLTSMLHGKERQPRKPRTTLLMIAVVSRHPEIVRQLISRNAHVDERDEYGFTALTMAISVKRPDIVQLLLDHHADPNAPNQMNMPPLIWALMLKQTNIVKILLRAGADPNGTDRDGLPPLYLAVMDEDLDAVRLLLDSGANANVEYKNYPVLRTAIEQRDTTIVEALLHHGGRVNAIFSNGHTALELARTTHNHAIAELLVHAGATE